MHKPRIAVTMGDPAGVGPEICLHLLADAAIVRMCVPVVFGDAAVLRRAASQIGLPEPGQVIQPGDWKGECGTLSRPSVLDLGGVDPATFKPGIVGPDTGRAAYRFVEGAIDAVLVGQVEAVSTAPLNKEALHAAGIRFPGHTEIFAARTQSERWCMMQYSETITCSFVTVHVGYSDVPGLLTTERILDVIELTADAMLRLRQHAPRIAVCGLNPHAGEHGLFGGREEERLIEPAIAAARAKGLEVEGPLPPDTAFLPAKRESVDAYVCMYHDQGHIPVKALAFDSAVNTTLGLPVIRTSVDHGTALDIAWTGKARPSSLFAAVRLAARLAAERGEGTRASG